MKEKVEPRTLPGFMELLPQDQITFNNMVDTIRSVYEEFGFLPLDTPTIELSEVLLAKAGGETEKQIYRFMKGDTDLSLRFDLTVPLARYVAGHYNDLILISLDRLRHKNASRKPSYWKTIESVASYNRVSKSRVKTALDGMISQKYIEVITKKTGRNHEYTQQLLEVDWTQLQEDGLWQPAAR